LANSLGGPEKAGVGGSTPSLATIIPKNLGVFAHFLQPMADSARAKKVTGPDASVARRYGLAFVSVTGALLLDLLFHHLNLPHPFAAFALSAIAPHFGTAARSPVLWRFCVRR
jgi:hypothetical protein